MFIKTNDRLVNLMNVSNINVIHDANKNRFRIIFNMNYNIEMKIGTFTTKFISDYVYWDSPDRHSLGYNLTQLDQNEYFRENFIDQINGNGYINKNEISSIKFDFKQRKVIFNLSHPVTFKDFDGNQKLTSEFVYVNCDNDNQYHQYVKYIETQIGEK